MMVDNGMQTSIFFVNLGLFGACLGLGLDKSYPAYAVLFPAGNWSGAYMLMFLASDLVQDHVLGSYMTNNIEERFGNMLWKPWEPGQRVGVQQALATLWLPGCVIGYAPFIVCSDYGKRCCRDLNRKLVLEVFGAKQIYSLRSSKV